MKNQPLNESFDINPYNVFGVRRVSFPPEHFEYSNIEYNYNIKDAIIKWVETNLKSRYYIGQSVKLDKDNAVSRGVRIGFEDSKELSYFLLACPYLKYN